MFPWFYTNFWLSRPGKCCWIRSSMQNLFYLPEPRDGWVPFIHSKWAFISRRFFPISGNLSAVCWIQLTFQDMIIVYTSSTSWIMPLNLPCNLVLPRVPDHILPFFGLGFWSANRNRRSQILRQSRDESMSNFTRTIVFVWETWLDQWNKAMAFC